MTSCSETNSNDPKTVYKNWAGSNPTSDLNLVNGQYWKSSHWTNEYVMYLELKPTKKWWTEFRLQNKLTIDTTNTALPTDKPSWFNPTKPYLRFKIDNNFDQGSRYYFDTLTENCFIYEIQL